VSPLRGWPALAALLAAGTIVALTLLAGDWWVAAPAGFILGILTRGLLAPVLAGAAGLLGWGIPLAAMAMQAPVGRAAVAIGAILGAPDPLRGAVAVVLTLLIGALLGLAGSWAGVSLRRLSEVQERG
jgi:hypothetical protein